MSRRVIIIGAGPVGSYSAYLFAKKGYDVEVYEEHAEIGKPIQCTGILTSSIFKFLDESKLRKSGVILNEIGNANVYSPNRNSFLTDFKKKNLIVDRSLFDGYVAYLAKKAGAKFYLSHNLSQIKITKKQKILEFSIKKDTSIKYLTLKLKESDVVVGADGPLSKIRRVINPKRFSRAKSKLGIQARIEFSNDNFVNYFPFVKDYGWFVPEDKNIGRLGMAGMKNSRDSFEKFAKYFLGSDLNPKHVLEYQAGLIPNFNPQIKFEKSIRGTHFFIVGDAAGMVKATTGGGIVPGFMGAKALAKSVGSGQEYKLLLSKQLFPKLKIHLLLSKIMSRLKAKDWDELIKILSSRRVVKIFNRIDRDNIIWLAFRIVIAKPSLIKYIRFLF